jgi:hypothetical protein
MFNHNPKPTQTHLHMSVEGVNVDRDHYINLDPSCLEAGLHGGDNHPPDQHPDGDLGRAHQMNEAGDQGDEDTGATTTPNPWDYYVAPKPSRQNQHSRKSNWRRFFEWTKWRQHDQSLGVSGSKPDSSLYTKFEDEPTQEKSSGLYSSHEYQQDDGEPGDALQRKYTQAATETVQTFLRHTSRSIYPPAEE